MSPIHGKGIVKYHGKKGKKSGENGIKIRYNNDNIEGYTFKDIYSISAINSAHTFI